MNLSFSRRLTEQLSLKLSADVASWLDHGPWLEVPDTLFNQPVDPVDLVGPPSTTIWGGQMLPDTLPFLSDGAGNVLSLRFGFDGTVAEVICWNHEGGGWKPYGRTLAEALLLDVGFALLNREYSPDDNLLIFADWARDWLQSPDDRQLLDSSRGPLFLTRLSELGLGQVAVHQWQCERHLATKLNQASKTIGGGKLAKNLGVDWPTFRKWLADPTLIPFEHQAALSSITAIPVPDLVYQDWERAADEAQAVLAIRTDLNWPFTVLGRYEERRDNLETALGYYLKALETMKSSAGFTESWAALTGSAFGFAAGRLLELNRTASASVRHDYLKAMVSDRAMGVRKYWSEEAARAESAGEHRKAYECYYKAGWDLPMLDDIETVLDHLVRTARAANSLALSSLAAHHRQALSS